MKPIVFISNVVGFIFGTPCLYDKMDTDKFIWILEFYQIISSAFWEMLRFSQTYQNFSRIFIGETIIVKVLKICETLFREPQSFQHPPDLKFLVFVRFMMKNLIIW